MSVTLPVDCPGVGLDADRAAYIGLLKAADWGFEWSDDSRVWERGKAQFDQLQWLRKRLDPDYVLWNQHCPPACTVPPPPWRP